MDQAVEQLLHASNEEFPKKKKEPKPLSHLKEEIIGRLCAGWRKLIRRKKTAQITESIEEIWKVPEDKKERSAWRLTSEDLVKYRRDAVENAPLIPSCSSSRPASQCSLSTFSRGASPVPNMDVNILPVPHPTANQKTRRLSLNEEKSNIIVSRRFSTFVLTEDLLDELLQDEGN